MKVLHALYNEDSNARTAKIKEILDDWVKILSRDYRVREHT